MPRHSSRRAAHPVNPFYAARTRSLTKRTSAVDRRPAPRISNSHADIASFDICLDNDIIPACVPPVGSYRDKVVIGDATLYLGDCFDILPHLANIDAVVTDPPYGINFKYRSYDDRAEEYDALMAKLVPQLIRITNNGPCFVWQSPLKADKWHRYFPKGWRIVAACKLYPACDRQERCLSWDPVIFWSGRSLLRNELPRDWHVADLRPWDGYRGENPVPCPRPLAQVRYFCDGVRGRSILDPFLGSGTTAVATLLAGKHFVGIERDEVYFRYACERIRAALRAKP